jgi:hypothetical protein
MARGVAARIAMREGGGSAGQRENPRAPQAALLACGARACRQRWRPEPELVNSGFPAPRGV